MTVDEYERLVFARALDDPRIELIDGYLVKKRFPKARSIAIVGRSDWPTRGGKSRSTGS